MNRTHYCQNQGYFCQSWLWPRVARPTNGTGNLFGFVGNGVKREKDCFLSLRRFYNSLTISVSIAGRNAGLDGLGALIDGGAADNFIRFYDGAIPADVTASIGASNVLVESTMAATAFGAATNATMTAAAIAQVLVSLSGLISYFRLFDGDGIAVIQGSAGELGSEDAVIDESTVVQGGNFNVISLVISQAIS